MLDHFSECIRLAKSTRQEAIQTNVFAALLGGLRGLAEAKGPLGGDDVRKSASSLITVIIFYTFYNVIIIKKSF